MTKSRDSTMSEIALAGVTLLAAAASNLADQFSLFRLVIYLITKAMESL